MVVYIKDSVFGVNTSLPPICTQDGSITYDPSMMDEVFSMVFQRKQCDQVLNLSPILISSMSPIKGAEKPVKAKNKVFLLS